MGQRATTANGMANGMHRVADDLAGSADELRLRVEAFLAEVGAV